MSFQFLRSGTDNVTVHAQVCGLFCVLFMILRGFIQAKALKLVLPLIVHPALCQLYIVVIIAFCDFSRPLIVSLLLEACSLIVRQYCGFHPSESRQLPIRRAIETNVRHHLVNGLIFAGFILDWRTENS